jgi:raffinose/stachyose/melibiose transport system permease protein
MTTGVRTPTRTTAAPGAKRPRPVKSIVLYVVAVVVGATILVPLFYAIIGGFKNNPQLLNNPIGLPSPWLFSNYAEILTSNDFWRPLLNSMLIALSSTLLVVLVSAMAAFVFARFAFRGRELLFTGFLVGLMFPFAVVLLPLFITLRELGLLANPLGVIFPQAAYGIPITLLILRGFFRAIPAEIEESATLDGCGPFTFFWRILVPMARPSLAVVAVLALVGSWNDFLLPLVVLVTRSDWWTIPLGVTQYQQQYMGEVGLILAYITVAMVPAIIFYIFAERHLVSGLTGGAVKG